MATVRLQRSRATEEPLDVVALAGLAMTRAAGAPAIEGNSVTLLRDAAENFPAWKSAIANAQRTILFECYIVADDAVGREFAGILAERARAGVKVAVVVDWLGCWSSLKIWHDVRAAGGEVRVFNPPRLSSPLGWLSRDHRKTIVVDGTVGFVSGLCVSARWLGDPAVLEWYRGRDRPLDEAGVHAAYLTAADPVVRCAVEWDGGR